MMHRFVVFLLLIMIGTFSHAQQDSAVSGDDQQAMRATIMAQLQAIQENDAKGAFDLNTHEIREHFGTPDAFMGMVRRSYSALYDVRDPDFIEVTAMNMDDGINVQALKWKADDGRMMVAVYEMLKSPDGMWRVRKCMLRPMSEFF